MTTTIDDYFPVTVSAAQVFVIDGLESFLSDDVAGPVTFLTELRFVQLFRADLADVTQHMGQHAVLRVAPLRRLLDPQRR